VGLDPIYFHDMPRNNNFTFRTLHNWKLQKAHSYCKKSRIIGSEHHCLCVCVAVCCLEIQLHSSCNYPGFKVICRFSWSGIVACLSVSRSTSYLKIIIKKKKHSVIVCHQFNNGKIYCLINIVYDELVQKTRHSLT